jgi:hypothetical protein
MKIRLKITVGDQIQAHIAKGWDDMDSYMQDLGRLRKSGATEYRGVDIGTLSDNLTSIKSSRNCSIVLSTRQRSAAFPQTMLHIG